jgi:hypothetical protein
LLITGLLSVIAALYVTARYVSISRSGGDPPSHTIFVVEYRFVRSNQLPRKRAGRSLPLR